MPDSGAPRRILLVRPSALGDVARTVPALASLRRAFPEATIDWLVRDTFTDAIAAHPALDEVLPFPRARFRRFGRSAAVTREVVAWLRGLGRRGYDAAFDLQGLLRSGAFTQASRAPRRVGFADAREGAWLAYNRRHRVEATHTVDRMLGLLEAEGIDPTPDMRLYVPEADGAWADAWLSDQGLVAGRYALVAPTAMWRSKQWPAERFDVVVERLDHYEMQAAVVVGAADERAMAAPLLRGATAVPRIDMVGRTSVGRLMALIERSAVALCNDSAALHLAVGLGRRCVGVFGPTDPAIVGPYRYDIGVVRPPNAVKARYRARPDDRALIEQVTVDQAWQAVQRVMAGPPPPLT